MVGNTAPKDGRVGTRRKTITKATPAVKDFTPERGQGVVEGSEVAVREEELMGTNVEVGIGAPNPVKGEITNWM